MKQQVIKRADFKIVLVIVFYYLGFLNMFSNSYSIYLATENFEMDSKQNGGKTFNKSPFVIQPLNNRKRR